MSLSYFDLTKEVTLAPGGFGVATLKPDVGQYWLPTFVHVSTATFNGSCSVHIGGIGVVDYTTMVDETSAGGNDTTAACSGMIVSPGMGISANFFGGTSNDTALIRVVGVSSDVPPTLGIEPGIPGHKFSGVSSTVFIANQPINVDVTNTPAVTISGTPAVSISGTPTVDIGGQPISVTEANKQMFANQAPVPFDVTIAAGSTAVILAASAGTQRYLHTMRIEPAASAGMNCQLEDTSGTALARFFQQNVGTPTTETLPAYGLVDFKGAPLASGVGVQLHNEVGSSQTFAGFLTYSQ